MSSSPGSLSGFWKAAERLYLDALRAEGWTVRRMTQGHLEAVRGHYGVSALDVPALVEACRVADEDLRRARRRAAGGGKRGARASRKSPSGALELFSF